jgi:hypothetical protein
MRNSEWRVPLRSLHLEHKRPVLFEFKRPVYRPSESLALFQEDLKNQLRNRTSRILSEPVQKLEARLIPSSEPMVIQVRYVSPDGTVTDGPRYGGSPKTDRPTPFPVTTTNMGAWMGRILNASGTLPGNFPS